MACSRLHQPTPRVSLRSYTGSERPRADPPSETRERSGRRWTVDGCFAAGAVLVRHGRFKSAGHECRHLVSRLVERQRGCLDGNGAGGSLHAGAPGSCAGRPDEKHKSRSFQDRSGVSSRAGPERSDLGGSASLRTPHNGAAPRPRARASRWSLCVHPWFHETTTLAHAGLVVGSSQCESRDLS
jgi:hypothetical protein